MITKAFIPVRLEHRHAGLDSAEHVILSSALSFLEA